MSKTNPYEPLVFFEYDHKPGHFCLMLSDNHMILLNDVFEANDQYGNGYGWKGVARQVVRARIPETEGKFDYDPEAGTFVAYGTDPDALKKLATELTKAFHDKTLLAKLIQSADPDWFD